jgi:signal transduction histidine kinase
MSPSRQILLQVAAPAVVIGIVLLSTCLYSIWYIGRLQSSLAKVLADNVTSLEAAQELEIRVRQLRFHTLLNLTSPDPKLEEKIRADLGGFEEGLERARLSANTAEERDCVARIENRFRTYKSELASLSIAGPPAQGELGRLVDAHPIKLVVDPCWELLQLNKDAIRGTSEESQRVSTQARLALLLAGLAGPAGGVIIGYGVARTLSRSIYRLSVRVQDIAERLEQDVASISIAADGNIHSLDRQLEHVLRRVEEVTERVQQHQRELLRAEQLSAVGQLGASVAHEVRNPLTGIKILVEAALRGQNPKPLLRDDLEMMLTEIRSMEQTVQGLLDFARPPAMQRGPLDLRAVVKEALDLVRARAGMQSVQVVFRPCPEAVIAEADHGQIRTILVNLLLNALDAMPRGGRLDVELEPLPGHKARIAVSDSGSGIAPEILGKLFTPFASSKPTGTGLGLSISKRIIEEHGGQITAANRTECGACFTITLPTIASASIGKPNGNSAGDRR